MKSLTNKRIINKFIVLIIIALLCESICFPAYAANDTITKDNSYCISYNDTKMNADTTTATESITVTPTTNTAAYESTTVRVIKDKIIYTSGTYRIKPIITGGKGTTTYISSNKSVATVDSKGIVTAKKAGIAKITVRNNGVNAFTKVTVKNPKLNTTKKTLKLKKTYNNNKSYNLRVIGQVGKAIYKSNNTKVATVSRSGKVTAKRLGKVTITVNTNGMKLKCRVTVKKLTLFEKLIRNGDLKVTCKLKKNSITRNIGTTAQARNLYVIDDNAYSILKQSKAELKSPYIIKNKKQLITHKQYNKIYKKIYNVTYSIKDNKIATVSKSGKITPKTKGSTILFINTYKGTFKVNLIITKKVKTTFNGKKAIGVYSVKETYDYLKDAFYNHIIMGESPDWSYLICYYKVIDGIYDDNVSTQSKLYKLAYDEIDTGNNFGFYLRDGCYELGTIAMPYAFLSKQTSPYVIEIFLEKESLTYNKILYTAAQNAFVDMNISDCKNDYEKVLRIGKWLHDHDGDTSSYNPDLDNTVEGALLVNHVKDTPENSGHCGYWSLTTQYLLTLQNIPCGYAGGFSHAFNIVKYNNKWYYLDIYWNMYFIGNNHIRDKDDRVPAHRIEYLDYELTEDNIEDESLVM